MEGVMPASHKPGKTKLRTPASQHTAREENAAVSPVSATNPGDFHADFFRRIVETAQEGIWITDPSGTITFANQIFANLLGYKNPSELVGRSAFNFIDAQSHSTARGRLSRRRAGMVDHYELKFTRKD